MGTTTPTSRPRELRCNWCCLVLLLLFCFAPFKASADTSHIYEKEDPEQIRPINFYLTEDDKESVRKNLICHGWPCPKFDVISDPSRLVQERLYPTMNVVSAYADGCLNLTTALLTTYMKLFRYRHGNNDKRKDLPMSVPVIAKITKDESSHCNRTFELWFFVNATELHNEIPKPKEEDMQLKKIKKLDVYVGTSGDKAIEPEESIALFHKDLGLVETKLCYDIKTAYVALYDTPWKHRGRRTEVWVEKSNC